MRWRAERHSHSTAAVSGTQELSGSIPSVAIDGLQSGRRFCSCQFYRRAIVSAPNKSTHSRLMTRMHEVDYKVYGDDMQFVEIELDPQEAAIAEAGGMMYMDDGIEMETIFGD